MQVFSLPPFPPPLFYACQIHTPRSCTCTRTLTTVSPHKPPSSSPPPTSEVLSSVLLCAVSVCDQRSDRVRRQERVFFSFVFVLLLRARGASARASTRTGATRSALARRSHMNVAQPGYIQPLHSQVSHSKQALPTHSSPPSRAQITHNSRKAACENSLAVSITYAARATDPYIERRSCPLCLLGAAVRARRVVKRGARPAPDAATSADVVGAAAATARSAAHSSALRDTRRCIGQRAPRRGSSSSRRTALERNHGAARL